MLDILKYESETCVRYFGTGSLLGVALLPNRGLSEVTGIVSTTILRKTVSERRIVTPETVQMFSTTFFQWDSIGGI